MSFQPDQLPTRLTIKTPEDLIATVPYLLGFHPEDSLVAVGYQQGEPTLTLRADLSQINETVRPDQSAQDAFACVLLRHGFTTAFVLGYGTDEAAAPVIRRVRDHLTGSGLEVPDSLRVHDGRWWSLDCANPECCPPEGKPCDPTATVIAATATLAGLPAYASRQELARSIAPTKTGRAAMRTATAIAERSLRRLCGPDRYQVTPAALTRTRDLVDGLLTRARTNKIMPSDAETAELGVLLGNVRIRDEVWVRITPDDDPQPDVMFWTDVLRRVEPRYAPAPATLLAFVAYLSGNGGLANVALDRAAETAPGYTMAELLRSIINAGVSPDKLRQIITPQNLATAYNEQPEPPHPEP